MLWLVGKMVSDLIEKDAEYSNEKIFWNIISLKIINMNRALFSG